MKFHASSFLLGAGLAAGAFLARDRLRPVAVEVSALGLHLAHVAWALLERQREGLEDLWAEVEERARERRASAAPDHPPSAQVNGAAAYG